MISIFVSNVQDKELNLFILEKLNHILIVLSESFEVYDFIPSWESSTFSVCMLSQITVGGSEMIDD